MKSIYLTVICLSLALPGFVAAKTPAKTPPADKPAPAKTEPTADAKAKKDTYPLYGEVVAVTDKLLTIKGGQGKEDHKYVITPETKIVKDEKPATIADVQAGHWVGGLLKKNADGTVNVLKLNVSVKQKGEGKAPAKDSGTAKPEGGAKAPAPKK